MRIFGKRGVKTHIQTGTFYCPSCTGTQLYSLKKITNFVSIFTVPLVKSDEDQPYVECQNCGGTYITRVLDYDPNTQDQPFLTLYREALTRSLGLLILIDSSHSMQKKMLMLSMLKKFGDEQLDMLALENLLELERKKSDSAFDSLDKLKHQLNDRGRNLILKCALSVATIDSDLTEFELVVITKYAEALGISSSALVSLINEIQTRSAA